MINDENFDQIEEQEQLILFALYEHYKGNHYRIIATALNSSDKRKTVVYQNVDNGKLWLRDFDEFIGFVDVDGETKKRFELVGFEDASMFVED
jgi:hypothetical protein